MIFRLAGLRTLAHGRTDRWSQLVRSCPRRRSRPPGRDAGTEAATAAGTGNDSEASPAEPAVPGGEVRYIGRLGLRDEAHESLLVDWRAPAAAAFYRATPTDRMGVVRRRTIRSSGET